MNLLTVNEKDFFNKATQRYKETGKLASVIRQCICFNVTANLIKKFSPKITFPVTWDKPAMFAISEEGWRGNFQKLTTTYKTDSNILAVKKDFVLESENLLIFTNYDSEYAFAAVEAARKNIDINWVSRNEPEIKFTDLDGLEYDHFKISGEVSLDEENLTPVSGPTYRRHAFNIPARELSCFSILALELLIKESASFKDDQQELIELRKAEKSTRALIKKSSEMLNVFWDNNSIEKEDFWFWVRKLQARLSK